MFKEINRIVVIFIITLSTLAICYQGGFSISVLMFVPFTLGPLLINLLLIHRWRGRICQAVLLSSSILYGLWFAYAYRDIFYVHLDAQGAIAFLFIGIYSLPVMLILWIAAFCSKNRNAALVILAVMLLSSCATESDSTLPREIPDARSANSEGKHPFKGTMPGDISYGFQKFNEAMSELKDAKDDEHRWYALDNAAKWSFNQGHFEEAKSFAEELEKLTPHFTQNWNYGNAVHAFNISCASTFIL